jgi:phospholipid transport system substrate-binding protein
MIDSGSHPRFLLSVLCATLALGTGAVAQAADPAPAPAKTVKKAAPPAGATDGAATKAASKATKKGAKPALVAQGDEAPPATGAPAAPAPADSSPMADLKKSNATLKKVLQKQPPSWSPEKDAKNSEVRKTVSQFLDFDELSRRSLARHWDELTPKQRTEFVATLRELVERNYIKTIHGQPDYDLKFDKETKEGNEANVVARLLTTSKGKKVTVDLEYKMVYKGGHWVVYDVVTDEQSLLENYRAEFNKIISKDGFDALLKRMRKKLDEKTE